jgi:alkylation response protein AidB-like acyl-CoA dehydrogenase
MHVSAPYGQGGSGTGFRRHLRFGSRGRRRLGRLEAALIMEAMAHGCPSTSAFISIHNMASWMIDRFGSAAFKAKYLPSLVTCDRLALLPD